MTWDAQLGCWGPRVPRPEIVLYQAPRAKLLWPARVLSRDGNAVTIQLFDKGVGRSAKSLLLFNVYGIFSLFMAALDSYMVFFRRDRENSAPKLFGTFQ